MSLPMIKVEHLTKQYAGISAVTDISFEVTAGEVVGFLGPNGAGKTTTMRMLCGYIPPSSGTITIAGMNIFDYPLEIRKKIGYLPESIPLYREMRVNSYLDFIGQLKGLSKEISNQQLSKVIETCGLEDVATKVIERLSKGFRQRVGLAQALIGDPEILILDEPTVGLDPKQIIEIRNLIKELGKKRTVILSTHILPEVSQICNRVLIINQGKFVAQGTPKELQASIKSNEVLILHVRGEQPDELQALLMKKIPAITNLTIATEEKGVLTITLESKTDIRPELTSLIVKSKKWDLLEIKKQDLNLEDIFLHLTTKDEA